jgi:FkbM family methyltransferase
VLARLAAYIMRDGARRLAAAAASLYSPPPPPAPEPTRKELAHKEWLAANGDKTFRLDYPLGADALVLDLGGYEGQWASDIFARYLCRIHVFEPVPAFADGIVRRFASNPNIKVHCLALGPEHGDMTLSLQGNATSSEAGSGDQMKVSVTTPESVFEAEGIDQVDLMKINIEGAEYNLLNHLIDGGLIRRIRRLQIQFHDFVPNAEVRMASIQKRLETTHRPTYQFPFIWENWVRKDLSC